MATRQAVLVPCLINKPTIILLDTKHEALRWGKTDMKPHKYIVRLSSKEKRQLCTIARNGKSETRLVDRTRILLWAHDGVTIDETAQRLGCHREKVIFWRKRFLERRKDGVPACLQDLPRPGRPPVFSPLGARVDYAQDAGKASGRVCRGAG